MKKENALFKMTLASLLDLNSDQLDALVVPTNRYLGCLSEYVFAKRRKADAADIHAITVDIEAYKQVFSKKCVEFAEANKKGEVDSWLVRCACEAMLVAFGREHIHDL